LLLLVDALTSDVALKYHVCFFEKFYKYIVNVSSDIIKCKTEKLVLGFEIGELQYEMYFCFYGAKLTECI